MDPVFQSADEVGIRLEIVGGLAVWEASPLYKHQKAIDRIRATITPPSEGLSSGAPPCARVHVSGVYVSFPDGSLKRPDISFFCREPDEEDEAIRLLPEAVIEVVSKGYEAKDLEIGPPFYLAQGVKDVIVFDPETGLVLHARRDGETRHASPVEISFECGCRCVI